MLAPTLWTVSCGAGGDFGAVSSSYSLKCTVPFAIHSGSSRTCLVYEIGRETKRSMGVFSLVGVRTALMAFVTTTLAPIVQSPLVRERGEDGKPVCRILECGVAPEVKHCIAVT